MKRCSCDAGDDGRKKFCGHHSDPSSRGGTSKRKLPATIATIAPPPKKRKDPAPIVAVGQCENHPHCVRGFWEGYP